MTVEAVQQYQPLATRMRPRVLDEFIGQSHLLGDDKPLQALFQHGKLHSMIFWSPPGTGKTTLAHLLARAVNAHIEVLSAVLSGVKDIRAIADAAFKRWEAGQKTIVFIDEIHRFSKSQQDALLPHVEAGHFILLGATTENPSFALNNALLSRARVYVLKSLQPDEIKKIIALALTDKTRGLGAQAISFPDNLQVQLIQAADGDARIALNLLEMTVDLTEKGEVRAEVLQQVLSQGTARRFDNQGEEFHNQISALHKSVRGSSPDATLYWFARMLDGGCDPLYLARRIVRMASEDIGNADPRALQLCLNAYETQERLGSPEGELALAQALVYLACAPKSNAIYTAFKSAMKDAKASGSLDVPIHLRNAPTKLMKSLDYGKAYRYAHDEAHGYAACEHYFPDNMPAKQYYKPVNRGLEIKIAEKLAFLKQLDKENT